MSAAGPRGSERFNLLASAIAGSHVAVVPLGRAGEPPWTDGTIIYVDASAGTNAQRRAVVVQASLLAAGSLGADILPALVRRPAVGRRYLTVEGHRALSLRESVLPDWARPILDVRLAGRSGSPEVSLAVARSSEPLPDPPEAFGVIRPRAVKSIASQPDDGRAMPRHLPPSSRRGALRHLDEDDDDLQAPDLVSSPVGGGGPIGRLLKKMFGDTRTSGGAPPGVDSPTHWTWRPPGAGGSTLTPPEAVRARIIAAGAEQRGMTYPEWDAHRRRYRADWCTITERDPTPGSPTPLSFPETHALRRPLSRLGTKLERRARQLQGIDIDIDAVVQSRVDTVAGTAPSDGLYVDMVRRRRDLAVLLLHDVSGSAAEPSPSGGTVHEHQRATAAALLATLEELGDRVALYSFRSQGRSAVRVVPSKRFGDRFDETVRRRLGASVPGAYTRLGAAIRHGAAVLERDGGTTHRLLVVVSDGFAYDHGYERAYGEADARRALAEARARGTGCLCLSVGAATDAAALRRVFGTAAHAMVPRTEQLPSVVGPLFRFALGSAEVQRRVSLRKVRAQERLGMESGMA